MCYLISACLIGENCKYNGMNSLHKNTKAIYDRTHSLAVCPEVLGGLSVPRPRTEIREGAGAEVLCQKADVLSESNEVLTDYFIRGAQKVLELARERGITKAILKARSPSCGFHKIYDGTFSGTLKKGNGVCAIALGSGRAYCY